MTSEALKSRTRKSLATLARRHGVARWHSMTKPELVRSLLRIAQAKQAASSTKSVSRTAGAASKRPVRKMTRAVARQNGKTNGHLTTAQSRDLCTTEVADGTRKGRHNFLDATVCDAHWLRAEWDLTRDSIRRAEMRLATAWHQAIPTLRLLEVTTDDVNSVSESRVKDVPVEAGVNSWYVNVPLDNRTYRLHIGYRIPTGTFFALAKSNLCEMPVQNANVTVETRDGDSHRHAQVGTGTVAPSNSRSANAARPEARFGRPLGFSSLSHFGPAATQERAHGEFEFRLDTEVIVHGTTRPGSALAVQGDPVDLREDGSFTIRLNQPEGRQVIAFTALSPRGGERRMVVLGIERNTKELERQYFDGGHAEGQGE